MFILYWYRGLVFSSYSSCDIGTYMAQVIRKGDFPYIAETSKFGNFILEKGSGRSAISPSYLQRGLPLEAKSDRAATSEAMETGGIKVIKTVALKRNLQFPLLEKYSFLSASHSY